MDDRTKRVGTLTIAFIAALGMPPVWAQAGDDMQALRREVESFKQDQKAILKDLEIIKGILTGKQPPLENVVISTDGAPFLGEKTAKLTMIEFSDFQCPFCGRYASQTYSQVLDEYVKTGKVRYVFLDFPLEAIHPQALKAAEAARCAGEQGKFWEMRERLFKNQQALDAKELAGHATVLGLDGAKFQQCVESGKYTAKVKKDVEEGQKLGVRGTPAFFFGYGDPKDPSKVKAVTMLSGAQPVKAFKDALDKLLSPEKDKEKDRTP